MMIPRTEAIAIHEIINKFEQGDLSLVNHFSNNINLAIEHYDNDADVSWQRCESKEGLMAVLEQLIQDVFPQGTQLIKLESQALCQNWYATSLTQKFWYGVQEQIVVGTSMIISHVNDQGQVDYFREVVQSIEPQSI